MSAQGNHRYWLGPLLFVLVLSVLVLPRVVGGSPIGLADNGDYERVLDRVGLAYPANLPGGRYFDHVNLRYIRAEPRNNGYASSALLPAGLTRLLASSVRGGAFDLRWLGLLHVLLLLTALGWVALELERLRWPALRVTALLAFVVLADVGYIAYANSFYAEPSAVFYWWLMLAAALACCQDQPGAPRWWPLVGFTLAASALLMAKAQYAPLALPLALLAQRLARRLRWALRGALPVAILLAVGVASFHAVPDRFREANLYNLVFGEITAHSAHPERDLAALGLDASLARFAGTTAYDPQTPVRDPAFRAAFSQRIGYGAVIAFYVRSPQRLWQLAARAARQAFELRPRYLGNAVMAAGIEPKHQATRFALWSDARRAVFPGSFLFILFASNAVGALLLFASRRATSRALGSAYEVVALVPVMALVQYLSVIVGEGEYEVVKHLFLFNLAFDTALLAAIGAVTETIGRLGDFAER